MNPRRLELAITLCEPNHLDDLHGDNRVTRDMLLCHLKRIHTLLSGQLYYDYYSQQWIDADDTNR